MAFERRLFGRKRTEIGYPRPAQSGVTSTTRSLVSVARAEQFGLVTAASAYYAFVSLVSLLLVTVAVPSAVAGPNFAAAVLATVGGVFSPDSPCCSGVRSGCPGGST